jgi:methylglutaconyl-CoA hydratase
MDFQTLAFSIAHGIARLALNRPEVKNAFNAVMLTELQRACVDLKGTPDVRALVLTGTGDHFCSGADLKWMKDSIKLSKEENMKDAIILFETFYDIAFLPYITVGVANGPSYGGGLGLLGACDITVAAEEASFAFTEVRIGLSPAVISPFILRKARHSWVRDVMLTGRIFTAREGLEHGFFQRVVPAAGLDETVQGLIRDILKTSPAAVKKTKELLDKGMGFQPLDLKDYLAGIIADIRVSREGQEGLKAFFEKRKPSWHVES